MITKEQLEKYTNAYLYQLREGILGLEDEKELWPDLPNIERALQAFFNAQGPEEALQIYAEDIKDHEDKESLLHLARKFFFTPYTLSLDDQTYAEMLARAEQDLYLFLQLNF
jgi:hypothetical protein